MNAPHHCYAVGQNGHGKPTLERSVWVALTKRVYLNCIGSLIGGKYHASSLVYSSSYFPHEMVQVDICHHCLEKESSLVGQREKVPKEWPLGLAKQVCGSTHLRPMVTSDPFKLDPNTTCLINGSELQARHDL